MSKAFSTPAAAIALSFGLAAMGSPPALATNYHDYHPWAQSSTQAGYAAPMPVYARKYGGRCGTRSPQLVGGRSCS
jgi:hypothetical protein